MIRLTYLAVLFLSCSADPRSPRIYNVLISSKKNLSPSHAEPVYEPVLRTTSVGYAFPSLYYHTSFVQNVPTSYITPDYSGFTKIETTFVNQREGETSTSFKLPRYASQLPLSREYNIQPQLSQEITKDTQQMEPDPTEQFLPYDPYALSYNNYLPKEQNGRPVDSSVKLAVPQQEESDPKSIIANLKKNPEIPDVPPPPLPVKTSKTS